MNATDFSSRSARTPRWLWIVGGLLLAFIVFIVVFDWNWLRGPIERRVTAATGREFSIDGDLGVDLGLTPRIRADRISLANPPGARAKRMATLERLELRIKLLPLLRGRVELPYVDLQTPRLALERDATGKGNWVFDTKKESKEPVRIPLVRDLRVENGELKVHEPALRTDLRLSLNSGKPAPGETRAPLLAKGEGSYRGRPFKLDGRVDSPLDLQDKEHPYHVDVRAEAGETHAHASGALLGQLQLDDFDILFEMAGADLGDLYDLLGIALPQTPPYALKGRLGHVVNSAGDVWSYRKFAGKVGDSDVAGDASIDVGGERPMLKAELVSRLLDFDDLAGFLGATPSIAANETASEEQRRKAAEQKAKPRVLPDTAFNLDKLRVMDADVKLRAERIDAPKLPLEKMSAHLHLNDGVLKLEPLDFMAAGGKIASRITLDARNPIIDTTAVADVRGLELGKLFPTVQITRKGAGLLAGAMALKAKGNSVADMLGGADGNIGLVMGPGHVSNLLVELAGLDVAESLKYLINKDRQTPLRCAYADFNVEGGQMGVRALAFDTSDTVIFGQGNIDLREEAIDLRLVPQPKDKSPVALRVPLKIGGTFKDPSFHPEAGPLILRSAAAAALYSVAPPAALLALIETGPGENIDCTPAPGSVVKAAPDAPQAARAAISQGSAEANTTSQSSK